MTEPRTIKVTIGHMLALYRTIQFGFEAKHQPRTFILLESLFLRFEPFVKKRRFQSATVLFFLIKQTFFYKKKSTTNHKPRPLPPRRPSPAPPPPPPPSIATRRPPTADHRPPTADRRPPRRRQAKRTSSRRHRPGCRGGADGRRETIERRALDAADDLVAVRASVLRVGKIKRF